ncbi:MAG: regulatory protein RecX [Bacillota bacterium]|nr:regulatory protein RecX [Bacillota bacterium]
MKKISWDSMVDPLSDEDRHFRRKLQEARSEAISFLGLAKKPSGKVRLRLRDEGYEDRIINEVIKELEEEGYLDDPAIARRMARQRSGRQAESRYALRQRMLQAGLSPDAVQLAIDETGTDHDLAGDLINSRFGVEIQHLRTDTTPPQEKRRLFVKIARFLSNRGFESELIEQILHRHSSD